MKVQIKYTVAGLELAYATPGSAGIDCRACIPSPIELYPQATAFIPLGFSLHIADPGVAGLLMPRSGLGVQGLILANTIGLIDSDYQGELKAVMWNRNDETTRPLVINPGDRIAQLVFLGVMRPELEVVDDFSSSSRGEGGFGSTGVA